MHAHTHTRTHNSSACSDQITIEFHSSHSDANRFCICCRWMHCTHLRTNCTACSGATTICPVPCKWWLFKSGWRSPHMSVMYVTILHLYTQFKIRKHSRYDNMDNFGHGIKRHGELDLWGHHACWWSRSSYSIHVPSLKFVSLLIAKVWVIFSHGVKQPVTSTFGITGHPCHGLHSCQFSVSCALPVLI